MQKITRPQVTLVDQVEDQLLSYFKRKDLRCGDHIPNEMTLATELGVARNVVREALSRLKMMGLIYTRPRTGMILTEPSILGGMKRVVDPRIMQESSLLDILGFRIALEIGISADIVRKATQTDIAQLEEIVRAGVALENNEYSQMSEFDFHTKLYQISGNKTILEFQELIHPIMTFVKDKFKSHLEPINVEMNRSGRIVTHADLLECIKARDEKAYKEAIEQHFEVYRIFADKMNTN